MTDFDPNLVPIRPAATVLLVTDAPELKVLMMKRHANTVFAGGMWVFPGGAVDPEDAETPSFGGIELDYPGPIDDDHEDHHRAYYVAAIRECFEEAGILLTRSSQPSSSNRALSEDQLQVARDRINAGELTFTAFLAANQLQADLGEIQPVARWITPKGSPKRFDARFFLATSPASQRSSHDAGELVDSAWLTPADIIDRAEREEMTIMTPTLRMIQNLCPFNSVSELRQGLKAHRTYDRVRVDPNTRDLLLPGESGYESAADNIETGWVRLKPAS